MVFLGMATICGAGRGMVETHFNSMPPWDGATSCSVLVLVVINAGYMDMDTLQAEGETRETGARCVASPHLTLLSS